MRHANTELHKQKDVLVCTSIESNPYIHPFITVLKSALSLCIASAPPSPPALSARFLTEVSPTNGHGFQQCSLSEVNSLTTRIASPHLTLNRVCEQHTIAMLARLLGSIQLFGAFRSLGLPASFEISVLLAGHRIHSVNSDSLNSYSFTHHST